MSYVQAATEELTDREIQILWELADGKLNKEISSSLNISIDTVKKHLKNIYRKIAVRNRIEAAFYAYSVKPKRKSA
ncbi:MAG: helix-turn-helix transcriptional regulator [Sediminibacterium sp.]